MADHRLLNDFLRCFLKDQMTGQVRPLEEYQELFPGIAELIARHYGRFQGDEGNPARTCPVPEAEAPGPRSARQIGPYRILKELGRGGQGVVYLAKDERLQRCVALKMLTGLLPLSADQMARFLQEAKVASRVNHPNVCAVYDTGTEDGVPYLAMQYVEGASLNHRIHRARECGGATAFGDVLTEAESSDIPARPVNTERSASESTSRKEINQTVGVLEKVARALHAAHEAGVVHRDMKPGNIMVTGDGEPIILDFGLARDETSDLPSLTRTGDLFGTPAYMAPEQLLTRRTRIDRRVDVYAVGVTLYECLTLRRPFEAPTREGLYQAIMSKEPPDPRLLNPAISADIRTVLDTAMEKDRDRRYQTAFDLAEELRRVREREPIHARPVTRWIKVMRWAQRNPAVAASLALAFLFLMVGLVVSLVLLGEAQDARDTARRETARAERMLAFLTRQMLGPLTPQMAVGQPISVKQMLDTAGSMIEEEFADDPVARWTLHRSVADAYAGLGYVHEAAFHYRAAGSTGDEVDPATRILRDLEKGLTVFQHERDLSEEVSGERGWAKVEKAMVDLNRLSPGLGDALHRLREGYRDQAAHEEIWPGVRDRCRAAVERDPRLAPVVAWTLCFLADAATVNTVPDPGIDWVREAISLYEGSPRSTRAQQLGAWLQLGWLEYLVGNHDEAFGILEQVPAEALDLPPESPSRFRHIRLRAVCLAHAGDFAQAADLLLPLADHVEQEVGSRYAAPILVTLKWLHDFWDRAAGGAAEEAAQKAAAFRRRYLELTGAGQGGFLHLESWWFFDRESPELAAALRRVALLSWRGEDDLALACENLLRLMDATLLETDPARLLVGQAIARALVWRRRGESRPELMRRAAALVCDFRTNPRGVLHGLAARLIRRRRGDEAIPFLEALLHPKRRALMEPDHVAGAEVALGEALLQAGRREEAEALLERRVREILKVADLEQLRSKTELERAPWLLVASPASPRYLQELAYDAVLALARRDPESPALGRALALARLRLDCPEECLEALTPAKAGPLGEAIRVLALHRLGRHLEASAAVKALPDPLSQRPYRLLEEPDEQRVRTWIDWALVEEARSLVMR